MPLRDVAGLVSRLSTRSGRQQCGEIFIAPGDEVYQEMTFGENARA